jgi:hypothetical protein
VSLCRRKYSDKATIFPEVIDTYKRLRKENIGRDEENLRNNHNGVRAALRRNQQRYGLKDEKNKNARLSGRLGNQ